MSNELLQRLEDKIDNAIETIELLRLQTEELEDKNARLMQDYSSLKSKQAAWEQNLTNMLEKLDAIESKDYKAKQYSETTIEREEEVTA